MGQGNSAEAPVSLEHLSHALAERFAEKCYTPLELYCYKQVFKSLSDNESGVKYWNETTLCRFLELPDALGVGPVIFQMASYLGAFPFPSQAPAILTLDALLKVVTILTERYGAVVKRRGREQWIAEIYRSLAVIDRVALKQPGEKKDNSDIVKNTAPEKSTAVEEAAEKAKKNMIFSVDEGIEDIDDDDDMLMITALDFMDADDVLKKSEKVNWHHSFIPSDNFLKLIELLLLIAPLDPQDSISKSVGQLSDERLQGLRKTARHVLVAFGVDDTPGIPYGKFKIIISTSLPYLFDGLNPLFEHFLFAKNFDLHKKKGSIDTTPPTSAPAQSEEPPPPEPILASEGDILNLNVLSQLSFFIKGSNLFRRLRLLYSGNEHGFSMGSFEKAVFNWKAPSILLVSGTLLPPTPSTPSERTFADSLPPKRLPSSMSDNLQIRTVTFGAYIPVPWKQTPKTPFGDSSTLLFQLAPTHDVFAASKAVTDYAYFCRPPSKPSGLGFGSSLPQASTSYHGNSKPVMLGPTSLHLDDALEFGVFTHVSAGGGSFYPSRNPSRRDKDWQDRFSVEALEVWGCGGDEEAEAQRKAWKWEENEAEMRRRVNVGRGDVEADRQLLEMAGLIGGNRSGGSV